MNLHSQKNQKNSQFFCKKTDKICWKQNIDRRCELHHKIGENVKLDYMHLFILFTSYVIDIIKSNVIYTRIS